MAPCGNTSICTPRKVGELTCSTQSVPHLQQVIHVLAVQHIANIHVCRLQLLLLMVVVVVVVMVITVLHPLSRAARLIPITISLILYLLRVGEVLWHTQKRRHKSASATTEVCEHERQQTA